MAISIFLLPLDQMSSWISVVGWIVLVVALVVTVVTGVEYAYQGWRLRRDALRAARTSGQD